MEHPSLSRYHCILQFNTDGDAFIYDLNSAHGTRLNKQRIQPRVYIPLRNGDQLRFGESTRICIFETEKENEELETEHLIRRRQKQQGSSYTSIGAVEDEEDEGITWGFREDAEEEPDEEEDENETGKGKRTGDAALIDIAQEKMMAEDASKS
ncbi:SMAD/FHA domain-containing protein [Dichotomocladium elegans]|nr:SMAD/FHA domain-containing protein [Dichotomocladium elegans]